MVLARAALWREDGAPRSSYGSGHHGWEYSLLEGSAVDGFATTMSRGSEGGRTYTMIHVFVRMAVEEFKANAGSRGNS